jgi:hypothetical protein
MIAALMGSFLKGAVCSNGICVIDIAIAALMASLPRGSDSSERDVVH